MHNTFIRSTRKGRGGKNQSQEFTVLGSVFSTSGALFMQVIGNKFNSYFLLKKNIELIIFKFVAQREQENKIYAETPKSWNIP